MIEFEGLHSKSSNLTGEQSTGERATDERANGGPATGEVANIDIYRYVWIHNGYICVSLPLRATVVPNLLTEL